MIQLDLFKLYHPNVRVYYRTKMQPKISGILKNSWSVIEVSEVESVEQSFEEVENLLKSDKVEYKKPFFGFIKGGKYGG